MEKNHPSSPDRAGRIAATLKRIRAGLARFDGAETNEPAHIFRPEAFDEQQS
jgi:hypothetical protein